MWSSTFSFYAQFLSIWRESFIGLTCQGFPGLSPPRPSPDTREWVEAAAAPTLHWDKLHNQQRRAAEHSSSSRALQTLPASHLGSNFESRTRLTPSWEENLPRQLFNLVNRIPLTHDEPKKIINNICTFSCNYIKNKLSTHSISVKIWSQFEADIWIKSVGTHQQRVTRKSDTKNVKYGKRKWIHILEADAVQEKEPLRWCSKAEAANDSRWFQCQLWYLIFDSCPPTAGKEGKYFRTFPHLVTIFGLQLIW